MSGLPSTCALSLDMVILAKKLSYTLELDKLFVSSTVTFRDFLSFWLFILLDNGIIKGTDVE